MAELHEALTNISPTEWDQVPTDDYKLSSYLKDIFTNAELICNSVPPPDAGTAFGEAKPQYSVPNEASGWKDMQLSSARADLVAEEHQALQKAWGKAVKTKQAENPLGIAVYKMAGKDRHGAWFARRSVHEGMGFNRFRHAMIREFPESLTAQGGPGDGNVRGIGADQRLEQKKLDGVGKIEVYQLSAQFPGPTTPREFVTLLMTSDHAIGDKSASEVDGKRVVPRSFMIVSRPIKHPEVSARNGYILGQYESVELVREIPLLRPEGEKKEGEDGISKEGELNPVEWIMITRSDPGGGIPRFMVDRGTPSALISDVHKWLDWATNLDDTQDPEKVEAKTPAKSETTQEAPAALEDGNGHVKQPEASLKKSATAPPQAVPQQHEGVLSHLGAAFTAGVDQYAPTMVSSYLHGDSQPAAIADYSTSDSSSDSKAHDSDNDSFTSAAEGHRHSIGPLESKDSLAPAPTRTSAESQDTLALEKEQSKQDAIDGELNSHDKKVLDLAKKRDDLDRKLAQKRADEELKLAKARETDEGEAAKAKEKYDKELEKSSAKHRKELEKLEAKKAKEARKAEEKRRRRDDRGHLSKVAQERDGFREQVGLLKKEVELLHEQMGQMQRENTALAGRLSRLGGADALSGVREELGRPRSGSNVSLGRSSLEKKT